MPMTIFRRRTAGGRRVARPDEDPQPSPAGPDLQPGPWHLHALARGAFAETQRTGPVRRLLWPAWLTAIGALTILGLAFGVVETWAAAFWTVVAVYEAWACWHAERLIAAQDEHIAGLNRRLETYRSNAWESGHRPG